MDKHRESFCRSREILWLCQERNYIKNSGVTDKYLRMVEITYESSKTVVRCTVWVTGGFNLGVGLRTCSGSRICSEPLFVCNSDGVICRETRDQVEDSQERRGGGVHGREEKWKSEEARQRCRENKGRWFKCLGSSAKVMLGAQDRLWRKCRQGGDIIYQGDLWQKNSCKSEREDKMVMGLFMINNLEGAKLDFKISAYPHTQVFW